MIRDRMQTLVSKGKKEKKNALYDHNKMCT